MENSPLRKAHEAGRQAVKLQKKGLFEEAARLHLLAAALLQELRLSVPTDSLVVCSLEEQSKYHKRQAELAEIIKNISDKDKLKRLMMTEKNVSKQSENPKISVISAVHLDPEEAQLLKNFDEADSLLQILTNSEGKRASARRGVGGIPLIPPSYTVRPRKDSEVIEELQTVNLNLRSLVDSLVRQLHECREENKSLRAKLEKYESSQKKSQPQVVTISAVHIDDVYDNLPVRELPELAPLEEPDFDFSAYNF